jgi:hypothetical protein
VFNASLDGPLYFVLPESNRTYWTEFVNETLELNPNTTVLFSDSIRSILPGIINSTLSFVCNGSIKLSFEVGDLPKEKVRLQNTPCLTKNWMSTVLSDTNKLSSNVSFLSNDFYFTFFDHDAKRIVLYDRKSESRNAYTIEYKGVDFKRMYELSDPENLSIYRGGDSIRNAYGLGTNGRFGSIQMVGDSVFVLSSLQDYSKDKRGTYKVYRKLFLLCYVKDKMVGWWYIKEGKRKRYIPMEKGGFYRKGRTLYLRNLWAGDGYKKKKLISNFERKDSHVYVFTEYNDHVELPDFFIRNYNEGYDFSNTHINNGLLYFNFSPIVYDLWYDGMIRYEFPFSFEDFNYDQIKNTGIFNQYLKTANRNITYQTALYERGEEMTCFIMDRTSGSIEEQAFQKVDSSASYYYYYLCNEGVFAFDSKKDKLILFHLRNLNFQNRN